jgi:hypothetical protein
VVLVQEGQATSLAAVIHVMLVLQAKSKC